MPAASSLGLGFANTAWSPVSVPDPMPAIQKVAGVPPGVVKAVAQHDGVVIRFVSDSKVKVNAAELYELPATEPLPVPEIVMVRGSALASAVSSNPAISNFPFIASFLLGGFSFYVPDLGAHG